MEWSARGGSCRQKELGLELSGKKLQAGFNQGLCSVTDCSGLCQSVTQVRSPHGSVCIRSVHFSVRILDLNPEFNVTALATGREEWEQEAVGDAGRERGEVSRSTVCLGVSGTC